MNHKINAKLVMLGHSQAKVELYGKYLSVYLNILSRVPFVEKIFIFDLLCGEGAYENGEEGSPCIALNAIKHHYYTNNQTCPEINIWFNDNGLSQIDKGSYKVDRVKKLCSEKFIPSNVEIDYRHDDFEDVYLDALQKVKTKRNVKGLFFIDPYGYKVVKPQHIKSILESGNTEVILFLPASYMYRFAESSTQSDFSGGEVLRGFLVELFHSKNLSFRSVYDFIEQMKNGFRSYLSQQKIFVDTFTLERDRQNVYCLFFFTSNIVGLEKMLAAKWKMDTAQGRGFTLEKTLPLFDGIEGSDYPQKLMDYICSSQHRTNEELYNFGLLNGYLPKHTNQVLRQWKKERPNFEVFSLDQDRSPVRGFYIESKPKRHIGVKFNR